MSIVKGNHAGLGGAGAPGGPLSGGGGDFAYPTTINQSLRFNGSNSYLSKNDFGTATDTNIRTFSTWIKQSDLSFSTYDAIIGCASSGIQTLTYYSNNTIGFYNTQGGTAYEDNSAAVFRDVGAWFHIFFTYSHTANEMKLYINGSLTKGFSTGTHGPLEKLAETGHITTLMKRSNASQYVGAYLADTVLLDGYVGDINDFGENINGIWVPKNISNAGLTYGVNGFYLTYKSSDINTTGSSRPDPYGSAIDQPNNTIADNSGQGNHFTINSITANDVVSDTPTNNFATYNPLVYSNQSHSYAEGNLKFDSGGWSSSYWGSKSTFAIPKDKKIYIELEETAIGGAYYAVGIGTASSIPTSSNIGGTGSITLYHTEFKINGTSTPHSQGSSSAGDIIGIAVDGSTGEVWFSRNGTWFTTGGAGADPSTGTDPIGTVTNPNDEDLFLVITGNASANNLFVNFGQDSTNVASAESDANGIGTFEYAVPTDHVCLCASSLSEPIIGPNSTEQADDHFETVLYTGTGGTQHIGSGGIQHPQDTVSIANSLRFNEDSSLHYDITSSGNRRTWTFSAWVKRTELGASNGYYIFSDGQSSSFTNMFINSSGQLYCQLYENTGSSVKVRLTTESFNSLNKWYHIVWRVDTTQATDTDRNRVYVDGVEITDFATNQHVDEDDETTMNVSGKDFLIGAYNTSSTSRHFAGYMAEINFIDGQSYGPEYFGQVGSNGYWVPKSLSEVSYGSSNNSFRLDFADSSALGDDESGNANDFDVTDNIDAHDQVIDSPTQNFATWDPNNNYAYNAPTEGNLRALTSGNNGTQRSNVKVSSGKWYFEVRNGSAGSGSMVRLVGISKDGTSISTTPYNNSDNYLYYAGTGNLYNGGDQGSYGDSWQADGDIIGIAFDADNGAIWFSKNGTWQNSATAAEIAAGTTTNAAFTGIEGTYFMMVSKTGGTSSNDPHHANFGQDPTFAGDETAPATDKTDANGSGKFFYDVPTGFLALMDDNISKEGIDSPDFVWIKERDANVHHYLFDTIRGPKTYVQSSVAHTTTEAQRTDDTTLISFDSQGFTVGSNGDVNGSNDLYVAWMWKAGGPSPTRTYTVKVDADASDGDQNKYLFDGNTTIYAPTITLQPGGTYTFDQSDSSNSGHPLRFSTTSDGTHGGGSEYTTGVTTAGTPGTDGTTTIVLASDAPTLYYYCSVHSGMGGQVTPNTNHGSSNFKGGKESIVTANQTAGFSIATYVGDHTAAGLSGRPVGHGLLKQTEFTLIKDRGSNSNSGQWSLSSTHIGNEYVYWTSMDPTGTAQVYPTSGDDETVTVGISGTTAATRTNNQDNHDFIMYNFHSVDGYCKLGSYEGNGIADGPFVYTGFKPRWVMIKCYEGTGNWFILDSVRSPINEMDDRLDADNSNAEDTADADIDFLSNGFKIRTASTAGINQNNDGHFYIAFADQPFKYSNSN